MNLFIVLAENDITRSFNSIEMDRKQDTLLSYTKPKCNN